MTIRAILFDFDFTLGDSSTGIVECVNAALAGLGLEPADPAAIRATIGLSLEEILRRLTGIDGAAAPEFRRRFIACADRVMTSHTVLYPWAPALLKTLHSCGLGTGIVTTKRSYRIAEVLDREDLAAAVDVVVGSDMVAHPKPAPDGLLLALHALGLPADTLLYVGDTVTDAEAAAAAGVPFVAVLSGTTPREAFAGWPHRAVRADASAVIDLLR